MGFQAEAPFRSRAWLSVELEIRSILFLLVMSHSMLGDLRRSLVIRLLPPSRSAVKGDIATFCSGKGGGEKIALNHILPTSTFSAYPAMDNTSTNQIWDNDEELLAQELAKFQILHDQWISLSYNIETCLLALGLFGNALAFATLMKSRQMQTPSFVYHKALVLAYLIYCVNFLIVKCVNATLTIPRERQQLSYSNPIAAYYSVILNRVVSSVCGYVALYTSLGISLDRFLALAFLKHYAKFNRHVVAYVWVAVSLILSVCVHSWAPWLENDIETVHEILDRNANRTIMAYRHKDSLSRGQLKPYLAAKDWYNLTVRFGYAVLLIVLTSTVIYMFTKQRKKRRTLCNVSKRQIRRERSLFYLMVAVVIMAYIQVIPRESKRILEIIYPPEYVGANFANKRLPVETRLFYLLFGLYVFTFSLPVLNLCTIMERSLIFYFYFALNHSFRKETLILLHLRTVWHRLAVKLGWTKPETPRKRRQKQLSPGSTPDGTQRSANGSSRLRPGSTGRFGSDSSCDTITPTASTKNGRTKRKLIVTSSNRSGGIYSPSSSKCGSFHSIFSDYSTTAI